MAQASIVVLRRHLPLRRSGIDYFKGDADVIAELVAQNILRVEMAARLCIPFFGSLFSRPPKKGIPREFLEEFPFLQES